MNTTVSPILQSMLDRQAAGGITPSKAPAVQNAPSPVTPEIKPDTVEIPVKSNKKPIGKSLLKGGLIGGALGFGGGTGFAKYGQKGLEKIFKEGRSIEFAEKFGEMLDKGIPTKKMAQGINDMLAEDMGNQCRDVFTTLIKSSKENADDFALYMADLMRKNKFLLGGVAAVGLAAIGVGIAAVAHKLSHKNDKAS